MKRLWLIRVSVNASAVTPENQNEFECCEDAVVSDGEKAWPLAGADAAPGWDWVEGYLRKWCRNGRRRTRLGARSKTYDGHRVHGSEGQLKRYSNSQPSRHTNVTWPVLLEENVGFQFPPCCHFTHTQTSINRWFLKYIIEQRLERTDSMKPTAPHLQNTKDASFCINLMYRIKRNNIWHNISITHKIT